MPEVRAAFDRGNRSPSMWIQLMFVDAACKEYPFDLLCWRNHGINATYRFPHRHGRVDCLY